MSAGLQQDLGLGGEHGCLWEVKERDCWGDPSLVPRCWIARCRPSLPGLWG